MVTSKSCGRGRTSAQVWFDPSAEMLRANPRIKERPSRQLGLWIEGINYDNMVALFLRISEILEFGVHVSLTHVTVSISF